MTVIDVARKYIGQTEKPGNMGFNDAAFEKKMQAVGFQKKQAWCSYFSELCFKEAYPELADHLDKLFNASAVQTFKNFEAAGYEISQVPVPGTLVIWQHYVNGKAQWQGHAGVCVSARLPHDFGTVEGNTNDGGGREGYIVAARDRKLVRNIQNGLRVLGFVIIKKLV